MSAGWIFKTALKPSCVSFALETICSRCLPVGSSQLEEEQSIKNASIWAMKEYYANYSLQFNDTEATPPPMDPSDVIRGPCWETAVGIVTGNNRIKRCHVTIKCLKSKCCAVM